MTIIMSVNQYQSLSVYDIIVSISIIIPAHEVPALHCSQHGSIITTDHGRTSTALKPTSSHYRICHATAGKIVKLSHLSNE
jgi:hypothetical protein